MIKFFIVLCVLMVGCKPPQKESISESQVPIIDPVYTTPIPLLANSSTIEYRFESVQESLIYGREVYFILSNESISLYDQIKNSTHEYGSDYSFELLYQYNLYYANPHEIANLHVIRRQLESVGIPVSFLNVANLTSPYAITNLVNSPDFFIILSKDYGIIPYALYPLVSSILSYFIRERNHEQLIQWTELFSELYPLKNIIKDDEKNIGEYSPRMPINIVITALADPFSLNYLQEKGYINKDSDFLYRQFLEKFITSNLYHDGTTYEPFLTAYPEAINYVDSNQLSIFYPFVDDSNSMLVLLNKGLNTNNKVWEYQRNIDQIIAQISELDPSDLEERLIKITNINTMYSPQKYQSYIYGRDVFSALIAGLDYEGYNKPEEFDTIAQILKEKGLDVNASPTNYRIMTGEFLLFSRALSKYLNFFSLPTNTNLTNYFTNNEILARDPYNYIIKDNIDYNREQELQALIDNGYITEETEPLYWEYAIQRQSPLASIISPDRKIPIDNDKQARQVFLDAAYNSDWEGFIQYEHKTNNNVFSAVLWSIFNSVSYDTDYLLTSNQVKMLRFLADNGYDFEAESINDNNPFKYDNKLNNYNAYWFYDRLFAQYISEGFPIPQSVLFDEDGIEYPFKGFISFTSLVNDTNNILQMLYNRGDFTLSDSRVQQMFLYAVEEGSDHSVKFFIDNGIDLSVTNKEGKNAFELAWESPNYLADANIYGDVTYNYANVRELMFKKNKDKVLKSLPQYSNLLCYSPQYESQNPNSISSIQARLIQQGEKVIIFYPLDFTKIQYKLFTQNITSNTPIHLLMSQKKGRYNNNAKENNYELLQFLLDNGADPNYVDPISTYSALMYASKSDNVSNITLLLQQETIDLSYTNIVGNTVLHHMVQGYSGNSWEYSIYRISDRIFLFPFDKIDVNALNNNNLTFYWLLYGRPFSGRESILEEIVDKTKVDTNIGEQTQSGGYGQAVG